MNNSERLDHMLYNFVMVIIAVCSLVGTFLVAYFIFTSQKLRNIHPAKLIGVLSLCEFCTCWVVLWHSIGPVTMICYTGIHTSFYQTMSLIFSSYTHEDAIKDLIQIPLYFYDLW